MSMSDPIADMLTRIRNAVRAKRPTVEVSASSMKVNLAKLFQEQPTDADIQRKLEQTARLFCVLRRAAQSIEDITAVRQDLLRAEAII